MTNKVVEDFSQPPPYADAVAGIGMAPAPATAESAAAAEAADDEPVLEPAAVSLVVDITSPSLVEPAALALASQDGESSLDLSSI